MPKRLVWLALAALLCLAATTPGTAPSPQDDSSRAIVMHVGVPGLAYLGQPAKELLAKFPGAKTLPFAKQQDVVILSIPEQGISCYAVGDSPDSLKVASVGFNFDADYEGVKAGSYRTREGIGQGSTVNDVLGAYGQPETIASERSTTQGVRDPAKKYTYKSPDGKVKTYFVIEGYRVVRLVVNDLGPLSEHVLKSSPAKN